MSEEEIKDIIEILELAKEEIENNDENVTATLDLQDLKSLKKLYDLYNKEKEKNKELENADLTTVYMNGFYDGEKKWKDKIKYKIEELDRELQLCEKQHIDTIKAYTPIDIIKAEIIRLQELLEERN